MYPRGGAICLGIPRCRRVAQRRISRRARLLREMVGTQPARAFARAGHFAHSTHCDLGAIAGLPPRALNIWQAGAILVSMTRIVKPPPTKPRRRLRDRKSGHWVLQDAKARFSELVRKVRSEGPQHVTVHGRDEVVVIAAEEFRRLKGSVTGKVLIEAMQASPHREIDIEPTRGPLPVREVSL